VGEESSPIFHQLSLAAGSAHACSLTGGAVKCWGSNGHGELGNGTLTNSVHPVPVALPKGFVLSVASNAWAQHTCALLGGKVYCWGSNNEGQLGDGTQTDRSTPVLVAGITGASKVAVGTSSTCAVVAGGEVRCWGSNNSGQLGNGKQGGFSSTPVAVTGVTGAGLIALGDGHACAVLDANLSQGGPVKCWGYNAWGQVGSGAAATIPTNGQLTPVAVVGLTNAIEIFAGGQYTCAVPFTSSSAGDTLECWGRNDDGEFGNGSMTWSPTPAPVTVPGVLIRGLATGAVTACATLPCGALDCWGDNGSGQFGNGTRTSSFSPVASGFNDPSGYGAFAVGSSFTCAWTGRPGSTPMCTGYASAFDATGFVWLNTTVPVAIQ
jgi:alpha-tubulin suppressor-like RCC1 family protein